MLALALDAAGSWPLTCALGFLVALALVAKLVKFWLSGSATGSASPGQASRSLEEVRAQQQQRLTEAAQQRAAARAAPSPKPAAADPGPSASTDPGPPEQPSLRQRKARTPDDPNSYSARLAKLEKGKGDSGHNPLKDGSGGSSAGSSVCRPRKGG